MSVRQSCDWQRRSISTYGPQIAPHMPTANASLRHSVFSSARSAQPQQLLPDMTPSTYCLIVTRGHNHDEETLDHLANTGAGYVGMIESSEIG